jgi:hypothetical protein
MMGPTDEGDGYLGSLVMETCTSYVAKLTLDKVIVILPVNQVVYFVSFAVICTIKQASYTIRFFAEEIADESC